MNSINTTILVIFTYLIQSGNSFPQSNDLKPDTPDCKCQLYSTCAWSKQLINQITVLEKTDPKRRAYSQQFRSQVCNTAHRDIWCCRDGEAATEEELKKLNHIDDLLSGVEPAASTEATATTTEATDKCMVTQKRREPRGKEGKKVQKPCVFPFKFDEEEFDGCINFILEKDDNGNYTGDRILVKPWCSTKVDETTREHVAGGGFYGDCDEKKPQCPNAGGYHPPMKEQITGAEDMRIVVITGSSPNTEEGEQTKMEVVDVTEHTTKVCKASYPENVDEATAALVGNKMIICGGKEAKKDEEPEEEESDPNQSDDEYYGYSENEYEEPEKEPIQSCYSFDQGEWTKLGDLTTARWSSASVAISNGLWVTGGKAELEDTLATTEIVRPDGTVEAGPELPEKREGHCMVSYNGTVYSIGGYNEEFGENYNTVWKFNEDEGMKYTGEGPTMHYKRNSFACGIYHSKYEHDNRPMIVVAGVRDPRAGSSITSEYWDFTVPDSVWEDTTRPVPFGIFGDSGTYGPQMSQIGDGNELLMTYEKQIYSFHCDDSGPESSTQCFWSNNDQLQVERQYHVMMTVPSSIVEDC